MKYNIITINDTRAEYKKAIRERVKIDEVVIPATNAYEVDIKEELHKRGLETMDGIFSAGELGVWISNFDCWKWCDENDEELLVFEDDAIPVTDFQDRLDQLHFEIPNDYDFLTLWVPPNQMVDYLYDSFYDDDGKLVQKGPNKNTITSIYNFGAIRLARVYNGYGNVAQLYSPKGARLLIDEARKKDIYTPVDCFVYFQSHMKNIQGYAPKPRHANLVDYDWPETTVHGDDRV